MANPFYKNIAAFISGSGTCYRPANSDQSYTRADFFTLAHGDEMVARALFDRAAGEPPEHLLAGLLQGVDDTHFPPLPTGGLDNYQILSDTNGHFYDSQSLDEVLLTGGATLAATLQAMLDSHYGCICLHGGEPGILYCKAFQIENEHTAAMLAQAYRFLPLEFPESIAFICNHTEDGQALLCVWLAAGALDGDRLKQLHTQLN